MSDWDIADIPHLTGKTAVVTGANSGLGLETTRALAGAGAQVVMACRNVGKGEHAAEQIRRDHPAARVQVMPLDLANLSSVESFAADFLASHERLDILVNNAGVMALPLRRTADGFEMQIGTNHLGHFALTGRLLDRLRATPDARVVTVSSLAHTFGRIDSGDLNWNTRRYKRWPAYGQAKLANLVFALELDRRLRASSADVLSAAAHPGYAATHLQLAGPEMTGSRLAATGMRVANRVFGQSQRRGALPSLYVATAGDVEGGDYFGPDGFREFWGKPTRVKPAGRALKRDTAERLWAVSEQLTGVSYGI